MGKSNEDVNNLDLLRVSGTHVDLAVASTATVYSQSYICPKDVTFGFEYQFTSDGVIACTVEIEQGNTSPVTEGASDANMVVPDSATALATAVNGNVHIVAYSPVVANFFRLKITGTGANDASTVLSRFLINTIVNA